MKFTKMHGAGNDYVLVDGRSIEKDWSSLARSMCDRHFGIGADGLLVVAPSSNLREADIVMHMFNPDGSEAEMCGNGIRCFAKYIIERWIVLIGGAAQRKGLKVATMSGVKVVEPIYRDGRVVAGRVNMGKPRFRPEEIPVAPEGWVSASEAYGEILKDYPLKIDGYSFNITCVSMGNPHAVAFISEPVDSLPLSDIGPKVERHSMFPNRVNFQVVNCIDSAHLRARVWERGVGETLACGTGVCAIGAAAKVKGLIDQVVDITMPGGTLKVTWDGIGDLLMEGPAQEVFEGEWEV